MLCILGSSCFDKSETTAETTEQQQTTYDTMETAEAYCRNLEEKLQQMLSEMEGVGTCDVMITLRSTSSYQYAQDENRSDSDDKTEQKQEHVLIGNGDTEHALVESVESPEIKGVVVVCDGGENNVVKEQVYQVVAAALQIKNSQIYVARRQ
jgi:stage III sporulation protein AG